MAEAERVGLLGDREALREVFFGAFVLRLEVGKELDAELHGSIPSLSADCV